MAHPEPGAVPPRLSDTIPDSKGSPQRTFPLVQRQLKQLEPASLRIAQDSDMQRLTSCRGDTRKRNADCREIAFSILIILAMHFGSF